MKMKKKIEKEYVELEVINWNWIGASIITYPVLVLIFWVVVVVNFLKLLLFSFISLIPIINSTLIPEGDVDDVFEMFNNFTGLDFSSFLCSKKVEVKQYE